MYRCAAGPTRRVVQRRRGCAQARHTLEESPPGSDHRGFERCGSVVRPQEGYSPEILSHLSCEYVPSKGIRGLFLERTINSMIIIFCGAPRRFPKHSSDSSERTR